jgi:hypothetical protein
LATAPPFWLPVRNLPTPRCCSAAALGPDGKIYVIGGVGPAEADQGPTVEAYAPASDSWEAIPSVTVSRYDAAATTGGDGRIYVAGGAQAVTDSLEAYDTKARTWQAVSPRPVGGRSLAVVAAPDGRIVAFGGQASAVLDAVQLFSPADGTWSALPPLLAPRSSFGAALSRQGTFYLFGGAHAVGSPIPILDTVEGYRFMGDAPAAASMHAARFNLGAATGADGRIYAIGGASPSSILNTRAREPFSVAVAADGGSLLSGVTRRIGHCLGDPGLARAPQHRHLRQSGEVARTIHVTTNLGRSHSHGLICCAGAEVDALPSSAPGSSDAAYPTLVGARGPM